MYYDKQIRYIDYLENGEKQRNCGYVKMTVTDNRLLMEMQIKGLYETDDVASEVALEGAGAECRIGTILIRQGSGSFRWELKDTAHAGEELGISEGLCYGQLERVRVQLSPRRSLRCVWREVVARPESVERESENAAEAYETEFVKQTVTQGDEKSDVMQGMEQDSVILEPVSVPQTVGPVTISRDNGEKPGEFSGPILNASQQVPESAERAEEPQAYNLAASAPMIAVPEERRSAGEEIAGRVTGREVEEDRIESAETDGFIMAEKDTAGNRMENLTGDKVQSQARKGGQSQARKGVQSQARKGVQSQARKGGQSQAGKEVQSRTTNENETQNEIPNNTSNEIKSRTHDETKNDMEMAGLHQDVSPGVNAETRTAAGDHQVSTQLRGRQAQKPPHMTSMCEDKWQQLQKIYPHIRPFQDEREYLSLRPEDFVILHSNAYQLVQNSFLLHGFFNYDHLILTQVSQRDGNQFYIGVPGNFYEKEKQVAIMYGFGSFECRQEPAQEGDFGYYMIKVEL